MKLGEAELLFGNKPERGIRLVNKPTIQERELGSGLATIEQVEGLPVAGPAVRLFYEGGGNWRPSIVLRRSSKPVIIKKAA